MKLHRASILIVFLAICLLFLMPSCSSKTTMGYGDGIDISHHQGNIDWKQLSRHKNLKFVYIKATEGGTYQDPKYNEYLKQARRRGMKVGSYHFMRTTSSVWHQFINFMAHVDPKKQDLIPMIDVEECKNWTSEQLADSVNLLSQLIEKVYKQKPIIYSGQHFFNQRLAKRLNEHPLWIARYSKTPPTVAAPYIIWQFTEKAQIPGIPTPVDLNQFTSGGNLKMLKLK
ncbi:MAG: glycoside hydrolase family 25 protein [Bacteroidaceae bacterium]|nr:glycoside hydrolase family 25 protein [Bacteroidaceae bacterium]